MSLRNEDIILAVGISFIVSRIIPPSIQIPNQAIPPGLGLYGLNPEPLGAPSPGNSGLASDGKHVHAMPTAAQVGADPSGAASTAQANAIAAAAIQSASDATAARLSAISTAATQSASDASSAQSAAIASAATDATTKANNAQTAATSAASTDATTKANAAQAAAIAASATQSSSDAAAALSTALSSSQRTWFFASGVITGTKVAPAAAGGPCRGNAWTTVGDSGARYYFDGSTPVTLTVTLSAALGGSDSLLIFRHSTTTPGGSINISGGTQLVQSALGASSVTITITPPAGEHIFSVSTNGGTANSGRFTIR